MLTGLTWIKHRNFDQSLATTDGPLLKLSGDVVGVNTLSIDQLPNETGNGSEPVQGVFFAIPSDTAQQVAKQLIGQLQNNHAVGATVSSFYSTSSANYNYWAKNDTAPPPARSAPSSRAPRSSPSISSTRAPPPTPRPSRSLFATAAASHTIPARSIPWTAPRVSTCSAWITALPSQSAAIRAIC